MATGPSVGLRRLDVEPGNWNNWYAIPPVVNPPKRYPVPKPPVLGGLTVMVGRG